MQASLGDHYANPSKTSKSFYPCLVDIQSPHLSELATRIVIPLGKRSASKIASAARRRTLRSEAQKRLSRDAYCYVFWATFGNRSGCSIISSVRSTSRSGQ
ncbi:CcdB family protein [Marinobacter antarcticus]|uniref:Toxin CcdB n=1 Tax=Marinobacter antarcticus TaxID=564117 RepID=A0A831R324_9GAMM|nr:CcdB family protein [Marinobacter antarcticus]HEA52265.1 hypothetical protein [Marinobacter antarcticus]